MSLSLLAYYLGCLVLVFAFISGGLVATWMVTRHIKMEDDSRVRSTNDGPKPKSLAERIVVGLVLLFALGVVASLLLMIASSIGFL